MKKLYRLLLSLLVILSLTFGLAGCKNNEDSNNKNETPTTPDSGEQGQGSTGGDTEDTNKNKYSIITSDNHPTGGVTESISAAPTYSNEHIDYAGLLKLDFSSSSLKIKTQVKLYVDGDTVHFYYSTKEVADGVLKARFLGVNTPESTGKIEEWGKAASDYTKGQLSQAESIIVESEDDKINADSTGGRYLLWIWYRKSTSEDYRCLNVELLQNGLAIASSSANNKYGTYCMNAIAQAEAEELKVYSNEPDPDFYYGDANVLSLLDLRTHVADYVNKKVAFTGNIIYDADNGVYVEEYIDDLDLYCGFYVYYGFSLSGNLADILNIGNRVRFVGTITEFSGSYQLSGIQNRTSYTTDPDELAEIEANNTTLVQEGTVNAQYNKITADTWFGTVTVNVDGEPTELNYVDVVENASISIDNLRVVNVYMTTTTSSYGCLTLTCKTQDNRTIKIRTQNAFYENPRTKTGLLDGSTYLYKTINVKGLVEKYNSSSQISCFTKSQITIVD